MDGRGLWAIGRMKRKEKARKDSFFVVQCVLAIEMTFGLEAKAGYKYVSALTVAMLAVPSLKLKKNGNHRLRENDDLKKYRKIGFFIFAFVFSLIQCLAIGGYFVTSVNFSSSFSSFCRNILGVHGNPCRLVSECSSLESMVPALSSAMPKDI